jgi:hypothetical protein
LPPPAVASGQISGCAGGGGIPCTRHRLLPGSASEHAAVHSGVSTLAAVFLGISYGGSDSARGGLVAAWRCRSNRAMRWSQCPRSGLYRFHLGLGGGMVHTVGTPGAGCGGPTMRRVVDGMLPRPIGTHRWQWGKPSRSLCCYRSPVPTLLPPPIVQHTLEFATWARVRGCWGGGPARWTTQAARRRAMWRC